MILSMTTTDEILQVSYGLAKVKAIYGNNPQASARYVQFHESPTVIAGDVPKLVILFAAGVETFIDFTGDQADFEELTIAISSTENTYTAITDTGCNLYINVDTDFLCPQGATTIVGDLTTGVANRQVWAHASGPQRLLR